MKKLVFVTGAGRGIGRAIALHLISAGYEVCGSARSLEELRSAQEESHGKLRIQSLDVRNEAETKKWILSYAQESSLTPWGLVTAAGIYGPIGPFWENSWEDWEQAIQINLYGSALSLRVFAQVMIERRLKGRVIMLSGGGATQPLPRFSSYCASKAAVVRLGETVARELEPYGITVNSLAPGAVNTRLTQELIEAGPEKAGQEAYDKARKQIESGGAGTEKASALTTYLLSEEAASVNGRLISAVWDPWEQFHVNPKVKENRDLFTLRRLAEEI